jgi:hypothetical protein
MPLAMRRAAPTPAVSPKLLKHFAAATIVITLLLALFATDEDWGARAQIEANASKNQLAAAETEQLGTKRIASNLKVRGNTGGGGFGSDEGGDFGGGGGGGSWQSRPAKPEAGGRVTYGPNTPAIGLGAEEMPGRDRSKIKRKPRHVEKPKPDATQIEQILGNSRRRSGSATAAAE